MPACRVCQNFFRDALAPFHKYRQNALLDATLALINGASLTLTSIGRYLPGAAQVKNKIKRVDRLLGNKSLHQDIPLIFNGIITMLTRKLSLCVIAVDWSGYPSQEYHVLRASLLCDGRSLPMLSWIVPSEKQQNGQGHFYLHRKEPKGRKHRHSRCRIKRKSQVCDGRSSAKEPWLIFSSTDDFKPREIMKLYSRRMQIEQNCRDEKSERFGFDLRASYSRSAGRMLVLSLLATLSTIVLWLIGYHAESKGLHVRYQANSVKSRRVISYLTLAENVLRHSPLILRRTVLSTVLNHLARANRSMVLVY